MSTNPNAYYTVDNTWHPSDSGLVTWTYEASQLANNGYNPGSGTIAGTALVVRQPVSVSLFYAYIQAAGSGLTPGECLGVLYNSAGTLLGTTADQSSAWAHVGMNGNAGGGVTLTAVAGQTLALKAGTYWAGSFYTGTSINFLRGLPSVGPAPVNIAANSRCALLGVANAGTPPTTATIAIGGGPVWYALG